MKQKSRTESYNSKLDRMNKRANRKLLFSMMFGALVIVAIFTLPSLLNQFQDVRQRASGISGVILGVSPPGGGNSTDTVNRVIQFETDSGKQAAIISYWEQLSSTDYWNSGHASYLTNINNHHGAVPMVSWEPAPWGQNLNTTSSAHKLSNILRGDFDPIIKSYAQGMKAYNKPILLRWAHEMNGNWYSWGVGTKSDGTTPNGNTAQEYIDVWKRVHGIFAQEGATNVKWVWCPNVNDNGQRPFTQLYPGDAYVDWLCLDGYNWNNPWLTYDQVLDAHGTYNQITALSATKPLMLGEFASNEAGDDGTKKASWITDTYTNVLPNRSRIKAAVWFNTFYDNSNWPITSTTKAKEAFAQAVQNPYYLSSWDGVTPSDMSPTGVTTAPTSTPAVTAAPSPTLTTIPSPTPTSIPPQTSSPDTVSPQVSITYPTAGSYVRVRKSINIQANASDNVGVKHVQFFVNGALYCTDAVLPYSCSVKVPTLNNTTINLSARAFDNAGNYSTAAVSVFGR